MTSSSTAERVGRDVLGPVVGEFCLHLSTISRLVADPQETVLLFCARGGLRMQLAYQAFLRASDLPQPVALAPLMVSRAAAVRGPIVRALDVAEADLAPVTAAALRYELSGSSVASVAASLSGTTIDSADPRWQRQMTPELLLELLRSTDGDAAAAALREQATLFDVHLAEQLAGRPHAILVDTGFFGSTRELLAEGHPELDFGCVLLARSFRPGYPAGGRTTGLLVEARSYSPLRPRTALMRNWHFVEWLFEPQLESVRSFHVLDHGGARQVASNLERPGWESAVAAEPATAFAGVMSYLTSVGPAPAARIARDAPRAWRALKQAIVWPDPAAADALAIGARTHGFGRDDLWSARPWTGPIDALRGSASWREGDIGRSGGQLRLPLLAAVEAAYAGRHAWRRLRGR